MAKTSSKSAAKEPKKAAAKTSRPKAPASGVIEKVSIDTLKKLQTLGIERELQNDIEWCLGSYRADGNPVGLYTMAERAISVFKVELAKKTKGVTSKLITDLEKALQNR
jgi:hypothetical protein